MSERRQLINLAYRFLGSLADAEDVVQETYARWHAMPRQQQQSIGSVGAWLTTVASRICLDQLGSARSRRERYVGDWIPEPLPDRTDWKGNRLADRTAAPVDPADRITLDESVGMAFMVVLEAMTPAERVAFILHDVFCHSFAEVAEIRGRSPAACRQLASSAGRRIRSAQTPVTPTPQSASVIRAFRRAWESADIDALIGLLDPDATMTGDGGGLVNTMLRPIHGAEHIVRYALAIAARAPVLTLLEHTVNGRPGLVALQGGRTVAVIAFDVTDERIKASGRCETPRSSVPGQSGHCTDLRRSHVLVRMLLSA